MKIVFMGTPDFAAGALKSILNKGYEVTAVVTQPDRPKGRSGELIPSPVKQVAVEAGIPVMQPQRIRRPEAVEELKQYEADIYVVAAFGQILTQEILDMPRLGCVNIHASILPKYRGASPIQSVILNGEKETGVTIMQMDAGIDTGDMLYVKKIPILDTDTFETLHDKLCVIGGEAIVEALPLIEEGRLTPIKQNEEESTHVSMIDKSEGEMKWTEKTAEELDRQIRAFNPWPSAFTRLKNKQVKVWKAIPMMDSADAGAPGTVVAVDKESITVACKTGALKILELQPEGKKRMSTHDYLLGMKVAVGEQLG